MDFYKLEGNRYALYRGSDLLKAMPVHDVNSERQVAVDGTVGFKETKGEPVTFNSIAIAYLEEDKSRVTHGCAVSMKEWLKAHNETSKQKAKLLTFPPKTPAEKINRALSDPKYLIQMIG